MKIADFRIQTTAPDAPSSSSVIGVYANTSGVLVTKDSVGNVRTVGQVWNLTVSGAGISMANGTFSGVATGSAGNLGPTGIAARYLIVVGPSGEKLAIPAYNYV